MKKFNFKILLIVVIFCLCVCGISFSLSSEIKEINEIHILSDGYKEGKAGSFDVIKNARWVERDEAQISFDVNTIEFVENYKDVILVLDNSKSMDGDKISILKNNTVDLVDELLNEKNNSVSLITFSDDATILSDFSNDKDVIIEHVKNLEAIGTNTDYYKALKKVESILSNYKERDNTDLIVLFLTDGYPNVSNQVAQYRLLKENFPFITINGVQYELGKEVIKEIKSISDNQFVASQDTLENALFKAVYMPQKYEKFVLTDYINTDYWYIDDVADISASIGKISFDAEAQIFAWDLSDYLYSGEKNISLNVNIKLKDDFVNVKGLYDTNSKTIVETSLKGKENVNEETFETPKLKNYRIVTFDSNHPDSCGKSVYSEEYFVFSKVTKPQEKHTCPGYSYKGYDVVEEVEYINDDIFIVPSYDVVARGIWTKNTINKSMDGTVHEKLTLYKTVEKEYISGSSYGGLYTGTDSQDFANNVYYYKGDFKNNNVLFGGFCWKIIRTTDTGGVKIIYNGVPSEDGTCENVGDGTTIGNSIYNPSQSIAYVGYMYNTLYKNNSKNFLSSFSFYDKRNVSSLNSYFSDSYVWDGEKYILTNSDGSEVKKYLWSDNYSELEGYYTCLNNYSQCDTIFYVLIPTKTNTYFFKLTDGLSVEDVNRKMILGKNYQTNENGDYLLEDIETISFVEWYKNFSKYKGYYFCSLDYEISQCKNIRKIVNVNDRTVGYLSSENAYLFGNSVNYDFSTGTYNLIDTVSIWDVSSNVNVLNNYHYSCFSSSGECENVNYFYNINGSMGSFLIFSEGDTIETALEKMFSSSDVNLYDSKIKQVVDNWYENNLLSYETYIEDAVYCNERSIYYYGGFSPNNKFGGLFFDYDAGKNKYLNCKNKVDRFTVDDSIGNGALTYPVGLINSLEVSLNGPYILKIDSLYWTMSPRIIDHDVRVFPVDMLGGLNNNQSVAASLGVRPVISLRPDIEYTSGDGSSVYPYVIDLSE